MCIRSLALPILLALSLLPSCVQDEHTNPDTSPAANLELLWRLVDQRYCYFGYKGINWDSVRTVYMGRVSETMTARELFDLSAQMLAELRDGHVNLIAPFDLSRYWRWFTEYPPNFDVNLINRSYLNYEQRILGGLQAKRLGDVGYIRYADFSALLTQENVFTAIADMGPIQGLIIDVRNNGGGLLMFAESFVSCFVAQETTVGYIRYKEGPGHDQFSDFFPIRVPGTAERAYLDSVVVLVNRMSYSATNFFVAAMRELPQVTIMGDVSGGGGGVPISSELYNGWNVRFSTNPVFNTRREHIEFGVEPHIRVDMDSVEQAQGIDSILEEAIYFLSGRYHLRGR